MSTPRKRKAAIEATESNICEVLRDSYDLFSGNLFRFDTFSGQIMLMRPIPVRGIEQPRLWWPCAVTDEHVTHLMMWLQQNGFIKVSAQRVNRAVEVAARCNEFSAAAEALDRLPEWDEMPRLDRFWIDVCGADVSGEGMDEQQLFQRLRYLSATARCFFISIVARIMQPGCKVDTLPVLEGPQGTLKSSLLRIIAFDRDEWLSDDMTADVASKDAKAHLAGKLIVEMAEMQQLKASGVETLKRFLTVQEDKYRPSYGRHEIVQKRQCVFVGTTNKSNYFRDETGNRRFWPIPCTEINLELAGELMPQLYAEALLAYQKNEQWWLPPEVEELAEIEQDRRLSEDPWENGVATVVATARAAARRDGTAVFYVTSVQGLEAVEADISRWDYQKQYRVALILKKLGGKNMRLPREGHEQKRGYRFVTGTNGAGEASHPSRPASAKPLN